MAAADPDVKLQLIPGEARVPVVEAAKVSLCELAAMFFCGVINNMPYVVGIASGQSIVRSIPGGESDLGLIMMANIGSGLVARFINTAMVALNASYLVTFGANLVLMLGGLVICALARVIWLEAIGMFLIGFSSYVGETVVLCFIAHLNKSSLLRGWGSGTGVAGIVGAGYSFVTNLASVSNFWSFVAISPVVVIYGLIFFLVTARAKPQQVTTVASVGPEEAEEERISLCDCSMFDLRRVGWIFNISAVYFLEYVVQGVYADRSTDSCKKWQFPLLNMCYQVGVFLSRSSLSLFTFERVWILTLVQFGFFCLATVQAILRFMPYWTFCIMCAIVGLFGGCSYVNVYNLILCDSELSQRKKEMFTSYNSFFTVIGMVLSTVATQLLEDTVLPITSCGT